MPGIFLPGTPFTDFVEYEYVSTANAINVCVHAQRMIVVVGEGVASRNGYIGDPGSGEIEPTTYRTHIWSSNTPNWGLKM